MSAELKIMSFNLRTDRREDGINYFFNRVDRILEVLERERPDLIGFQEVTDPMRAKLREVLPAYTIQGCGRGADYHGESMVIAYRKDEAELISLENRWLSMTPRIAGSSYGGDQSRWPRMFSSALIKHDRVEAPFRFINVHLDHKGAMARYLGAVQLSEYISDLPETFILTGDFNANPDTPELLVVKETLARRGGRDCTEGIFGTFHDFGRLPREAWTKIDYIFSDAPCKNSYKIEDTPVDGKYYSDHNAVCAILEMD